MTFHSWTYIKAYYNFIDSLDLAYLTSTAEPVQLSEVKKNGKTYKQPINIRSIETLTIEEKVDLYFNIKNRNYRDALNNVFWFQERFNLKLTSKELGELVS